jgi:hypothetical protein
MKTGNIEILDLDFEYKLWKNKLAFWLTEIELLKDRVHVLSREQPEWVFDNKLMKTMDIQYGAIKEIQNQISTQEQEMAFYSEDYPIDTRHVHYISHEKIRNEVEKLNQRQIDILSDIYPGLSYPLRTELIQ